MKKHQSGRSMVEMLGVLAIIGVLSVGGIAGYSAAMEKYRVNKTLESTQLVIQEVRTLFANQDSFEGLDYSATTEEGSDTVAGQILNKVASDSHYFMALDSDFSVFFVEIGELNRSACITIGSQNWSSYGGDYDSTTTNDLSSAQMSVSDVTGACKDSNINVIQLVFNKNGKLVYMDVYEHDFGADNGGDSDGDGDIDGDSGGGDTGVDGIPGETCTCWPDKEPDLPHCRSC